jgi:hypothetical protein
MVNAHMEATKLVCWLRVIFNCIMCCVFFGIASSHACISYEDKDNFVREYTRLPDHAKRSLREYLDAYKNYLSGYGTLVGLNKIDQRMQINSDLVVMRDEILGFVCTAPSLFRGCSINVVRRIIVKELLEAFDKSQ